ncbi:hypothetical protein [Paracoccus xiamenensis]|uniref:hypothetical protein n=1 Tax=Paracoccus xiamenensis TaxID=2714901 RepID=UPI00140E4FE1|nr:hypothetical protein [Paracoccus xiamenensis]NHF73932.1 hypothetical protein [Paracoccus xiamenensis]
MKIEEPATYRERYAAKAGAVIQSPGSAQPGWDAILEDGEELYWQGWSRPKLKFGKAVVGNLVAGSIITAFGGAMCAAGWAYGVKGGKFEAWLIGIIGLPLLLLGLLRLIPDAVWEYLLQRRKFYSLSNRRAFAGGSNLLGKRRLISWPITSETSFRLMKGDPPSVRFYEGRLESGRRPNYHAAFKAIEDADDVYKLLQKIQRDAV